MITLKRANAAHPDFLALVLLLDADLKARDGDEHVFYAQFNLKIPRPLGRGFLFTSPLERSELSFCSSG
ncbi:hypothetical protein U1E44_09555 [Arenibacter sp. GZD96]|uniref:hypothetical protein n=1 Tax=Aurantibrevibacter litoralis TaxID=3106030 RepID=UPI002AFFB511|nr:hypothetical protein [Arenibacter sp. GZD-96]MEA1786335.1 hypothetical protein [Arenibacter sp. GZD-96]